MAFEKRIYLDHAATTPVIPAAREAMAEAMARWANPSSPHSEGRAARAALEDARARIAVALDWDGEIILTSGASEAIAIALRGRRRLPARSSMMRCWRRLDRNGCRSMRTDMSMCRLSTNPHDMRCSRSITKPALFSLWTKLPTQCARQAGHYLPIARKVPENCLSHTPT